MSETAPVTAPTSKQIGSLVVEFDDTVLEPRPWTARQAEWAAELSPDLPDGPLLELCSGAGHIGLLAARLTGRDAVLVDASEAACAFAESNAGQVRADGPEIAVRHGLMAEVLGDDEAFPLVLADPPYIPSDQVSVFPEDPTLAIDGGTDGLAIARECLAVAGRHLVAGGALVLQLRDVEQARLLASESETVGLTGGEVREETGHGALLLLRRGPEAPVG